MRRGDVAVGRRAATSWSRRAERRRARHRARTTRGAMKTGRRRRVDGAAATSRAAKAAGVAAAAAGATATAVRATASGGSAAMAGERSAGDPMSAEQQRRAMRATPTARERSPRRAAAVTRRAADAKRATSAARASTDTWRAQRTGAVRAGCRAHRADPRRAAALPRRVRAAPTAYALPMDSLVAVAESAGLQWVNSDADKIQAAQAAMAATADAVARAARASSRWPLSTKVRSCWSRPRRTCRRSSCRSRRRRARRRASRPARLHKRRCGLARGAFALSAARAGARARAGRRLVHQVVPDDRRASAAAGRGGARSLSGSACQLARRLAPRAARRASASTAAPPSSDWLHSSTRSQPADERERRGLGVGDFAPPMLARAGHAQVVAEDRAVEAELIAQDLLQPARREAGRALVDLGVDHVRRHHARQRAAEPLVRPRIVGQDALRAAGRRPGCRRGCRRERSRGRGSACRSCPCRPAAGRASGSRASIDDDARIAVEGAVADHAAAAVVEVEHRREAEVDAAGAQLGAEHVAGRARRLERAHGAGAGAARRRRPSTSRRGRASAAACVKPSLRKRCTRPPSWSTQTSRSGRIDLTSAVSSVSWRRSRQLRANRISPPVSGWARRRRSSASSAEAGDVEDDRGVGDGHRADSCLDDDEAGRVVGLVGDADVGAQAPRRRTSRRARRAGGSRACRSALDDLAAAPGHRHAHAQADRLRERLLGREARRQVADAALLELRAAGVERRSSSCGPRTRSAKRSPRRASTARIRRTSQRSVPMPKIVIDDPSECHDHEADPARCRAGRRAPPRPCRARARRRRRRGRSTPRARRARRAGRRRGCRG